MSGAAAKLCAMPIDSTAALLGDHLEAFAAALHAAGVSPERAAGLLGSAAAATMSTLTLVAVLRQTAAPAEARGLAFVREEAAPALAA